MKTIESGRLLWLGVALALAAQAIGQATAAPAPAFDVATIKPSHATDGHTHIYRHPDDGGFQAMNISLKGLLAFAYDLPETRMIGGPAWLDSDEWDVEAKSGSEVDARMKTASDDARRAEKRQMVQALLAERFKLTLHQETRELPVYALVVAKGGPKLVDSKTTGNVINTGNSHIAIQGEHTVKLLAEQLARVVGRVVMDKTGIDGRYDITLRWTPENGLPDKINGASSPEEEKGPVGVLVVDKVDLPTEN